MKLFDNLIVYGPEKEGNGSPSLELSAQELEALKRETEEIQEVEQGETVFEEITTPESEAEIEISLDALLGDLVGELQQEVEEANKSPFEIDEETGLSLQGQTVQEIQDRLAQLENRQATDIEESIHSSRVEEQGQLKSILEIAKTSQDDTLLQIQKAFNSFKSSYPDSPVTIEAFIAKKDTLQNIVDTDEKKVQEAEASLATFEAETKRLIDEAYETELQTTKDRLEPLKPEYEGSEVEKHDKQVLLEQKLEFLLNNPEELFSDAHIAEILAVYGLQEGQDKIQNLQEQSKEAQEQQKRDDIKEEILQNIYWSKDEIPELTQAINADIEAKLKQLQEQYPDLEPITIALKLSGKDRFAYLLNSEDPELKQLAFWSSSKGDKNWDNILAEHPQLRQYVESQVNHTFADREQKKEDFHIQREKQSQERITATIENGVSSYKKQEVNRIQGEISQIQNDEVFYSQDRKDKSIVQSKEAIRLTDINEFKASIQSGVDGITINEGGFITKNDIAESNKKIDEEMVVLLTKIQGYITGMGYKQDKVSSLDDLNTFGEQITNDLTIESKKLFKDKAKITQLAALQKHIEEVKEQHQTLNNQKIENQKIFRQRLERVRELNTIAGRLPQYIKETLMASPMNSMSEKLDAIVQELQQYETSVELQAQRDKIDQLQRQIEELRG
jgi:hypothetical protein